MRFAVETWAPGYEPGSADEDLEPTKTPIDPSVEVTAEQWAPITPEPDPTGDGLGPVVFVDGVRRVDSRVWIDDTDGLSRPGLCASVAAGAVRCEGGAAELVAVEVERGVYTAAEGAETIKAGTTATWHLHRARGDEDSDLNLVVHDHMTSLEARVSGALEGAHLVVYDGPLRGRHHAAGVGYVKTQHVQYLAPELQLVATRLDEGQRTPLFHIGGGMPRWSWYLRLPGPRAHGLSGVVRLELPDLGGDASCAAARADQISAGLPRFASEPHKEARAPQNLYPIAGLEHRLRHRLGDALLLERALRVAAHAA